MATNSPLVTKWVGCHPSNYTVGRQGCSIQGIVIHHQAGTNINTMDNIFNTAGRNGSAHYGVSGTEIHQYVGEANISWHCGVWWGNCRTIGIETTNSTGAPDWMVSEQTFDTLVKLVADIAKRNNLGRLYLNPSADCPVLSGHRDWSATSCPGPYLYPKLQELCDRANAINYPPAPEPEPAPVPTISWKDIPVTNYIVAFDSALIDLNTMKVVKELPAGEDFIAVQKCSKNGEDFVRTEYSMNKNINNGVRVTSLALPVVPEPEPMPTPEPAPVAPEEIPNDNIPLDGDTQQPSEENKNEGQQTQTGGVIANENWLVRLIKFIISIFTRKSK